jgi:hypothetical protein
MAAMAWLFPVPLFPNSRRLSPFLIQSPPAPSARSLLFAHARRGVEIEAGEGFSGRGLGLIAVTLNAA